MNERTGTPVRTTLTTGCVVALISTLVPLSELAELVHIGTLFAFILPAMTWFRFVLWMVIGLGIYFLYGAPHCRLITDPNSSREADDVARDARSGG